MKYTTLISTDDLARHLDDSALVIVDCRHNLSDVDAGERAYRAAHIPGATFLHLDRDLSGAKTGRNGRHPLPEVAALAATFGRAGIDETKQVVAYDQNSAMWASRLWWLLRWLGHDAVAVVEVGSFPGQADIERFRVQLLVGGDPIVQGRRPIGRRRRAFLRVSGRDLLREWSGKVGDAFLVE